MSACPRTCPPNTWGLPMSRLSPRNRSSSRRSSVMTLSRSSRSWFMYRSSGCGGRGRRGRVGLQAAFGRGDAEPFLHDRARGGVLQELALVRKQMQLNGECRERRLVKARKNQLLFARIGVDVADREDPGDAGLEFLGIDLERLLFELQAP